MEHRSAFLTGASSGIGRALALELARRGVEVVLAARREQALRELADEISAAGGKARVCPLDVADAATTRSTLLKLDDELDGLDLVIANAGVAKPRRAERLRWPEVEQMVNVNVLGAAATLTVLIPRMVERGHGHLAGVSSLGGRRPVPSMVTYTATKAYLSHLLEGLYLELSSKGIAVTDVQPGYVQSEINAGYKGNMPFLMEADAAAVVIADGLAARKKLVAFPWQMDSITKVAGLLPTSVYAQVTRRMV